MPYATALQKALEKLRVKIYGKTATIALLYNRSSDNSLQTLTTLTGYFFVGGATDPETGEQFHRLEFYQPLLTEPQIRSICAVQFQGVKYAAKAEDVLVDSSGIRTFRLGPLT